MTAFGDRARRYPSNFNTGLWNAALPPVGGGQFPRQPVESGESAMCQGGGAIPKMVCKRERSSREFCGRRALVG